LPHLAVIDQMHVLDFHKAFEIVYRHFMFEKP